MFITKQFSYKINLFCELVNSLNNEQDIYNEYKYFAETIDILETKREKALTKFIETLDEYNLGMMSIDEPEVKFNMNKIIAPFAFNSKSSGTKSDHVLNAVYYKYEMIKKILFAKQIHPEEIIESNDGMCLVNEIRNVIYERCVRGKTPGSIGERIFSKIR
jgi:hypothetical protein